MYSVQYSVQSSAQYSLQYSIGYCVQHNVLYSIQVWEVYKEELQSSTLAELNTLVVEEVRGKGKGGVIYL